MIGNGHPPSTSFKWYAHYMEHGYKDAEVRPDRVEWVETRNLPTNNMHAGARIMAATARDSDSIQPPVYRLTISFDPGDPVDRDTMRKVADRTLRDLGLEEYQVVIVAHRDRAHRHLHMMVNRVHPERLNVWSNWWDWRRIERSLRKQEEELGLRSVPGKHARTPSHTRAPAPRRVRGDAGFLARAQAQAGPHLLHAQSWAEVERGLGEHGLSVQIKHGGMVVTDGTYEVKASEIDRAASRKHLERRLGPLGDYRARQAVAARTLDERATRVAPVPAEVQRETPAVEPTPLPVPPAPVASAPVRPPAPLEVRHPAPRNRHRERPRNRLQPPRRSVRRLYRHPPRQEPPARAPAVERVPRASEPIHVDPPRPPRAQPVAPAPPPPVAPDLPDWLRDLAQLGGAIEEAERRIEEAGTAIHTAEHELAMMPERVRRAEAGRAAADGRLREVYADPEAALDAISAFRRRSGQPAVLEAVRANPEQFGALREERDPMWFGIIYRRDTSAARRTAPLLAHALEHYYATSARAPAEDERTAAQRRVTDARHEMDAAQRARLALPAGHSSRYRRELAALFASVAAEVPGGAEQLARQITTSVPSAARFVSGALDARYDEERRRGRDGPREPGIDF